MEKQFEVAFAGMDLNVAEALLEYENYYLEKNEAVAKSAARSPYILSYVINNCVETTIRNFVNLILFDPNTRKLDDKRVTYIHQTIRQFVIDNPTSLFTKTHEFNMIVLKIYLELREKLISLAKEFLTDDQVWVLTKELCLGKSYIRATLLFPVLLLYIFQENFLTN